MKFTYKSDLPIVDLTFEETGQLGAIQLAELFKFSLSEQEIENGNKLKEIRNKFNDYILQNFNFVFYLTVTEPQENFTKVERTIFYGKSEDGDIRNIVYFSKRWNNLIQPIMEQAVIFLGLDGELIYDEEGYCVIISDKILTIFPIQHEIYFT